MSWYLYTKSQTNQARWYCEGVYPTQARANETVAAWGGSEELAVIKELGGAGEAETYLNGLNLFAIENEYLHLATWHPHQLGAPGAPVAPNYTISPAWNDLPWVGTYWAGYHRGNRGYWSEETFTNAGDALRYAAKRCAELNVALRETRRLAGTLPRNVYIPKVCCGEPSEDWFLPVPTPEITGEAAPATHATTKDYDVTTLPSPTCGNCGLFGHRKDTCSRPRKSYDRVGIEVEGRWLDLPAMKVKARELTGGVGCMDGSVYRDDQLNADPWEFQTKPDNVRNAIDQLLHLYPDSANEKCGMHVHVSFLSAATDIGLLASPHFFAYFKERWNAWGVANNLNPQGEFFRRLRGQNQFCVPNTAVARDVVTMQRYAQLNFSAWNEHKTIECRLLPMFRRSSLAVSAVTELVTIFEDYLAQDFSARLHTEEVKLPKPTTGGVKINQEYDIPKFAPIKVTRQIELCELPPVGKGMKRVAIFAGRTMPNLLKDGNLGDFLKSLGRSAS